MREMHGPAVGDVLNALEAGRLHFLEAMTDTARDYLRGRGFTDDTIAAWDFGWAPGHGAMVQHLKACGVEAHAGMEAGLVAESGRDFFFDRVMLPIRDLRGQVVAFAGRLLPDTEARLKSEGKAVGKYVNSRESTVYHKGAVLFGLDRARAAAGQRKQLVVVEGQMDVVAAHQVGETHVVACCGTALTEDHLAQIKKIIPTGTLVLAFDADEAGQAAAVKAVDLCWKAGVEVRIHVTAGGKDVAALVAAGLPVVWKPQPAGMWLVDHLTAKVEEDRADRLTQADRVLDALQVHGDRQWLELHAEHLAERLSLGRKLVLDRLRDRTRVTVPAPNGAAAGGGDARGLVEADGGFHRAVIARISGFLTEEDLVPDAVSGWMRGESGIRIGVKTRDLVERFLFRYAGNFDSLSKERVGWTLSALVQDRRRERRADVMAPLTQSEAQAAGMDELVRWVRAVTGQEDPVDVAVMAHFLWQVKRRALGLEVDHDVMPILVGHQGDGKSRAVKRLCAVWAELNLAVNANTLTDDRCKEALADYVIGIWDELQGGNKADVQALKNIITADIVAYRELGSHTYNVLPKTITLIATSNDHVADIIPDATGARRYYELASARPKCEWDTINGIRYGLLWTAVSHDQPAPILPHLEEVRRRQRGLVHQDPVILWLHGESFDELVLMEADRRDDTAPGGGMGSSVIPAYQVERGEVCDHTFRRFARWCRLHGQTAIAPNKFGGRLNALGIRRQRDARATNGVRAWRYHLPIPCPEDWAVADRLTPVPVKTPEQRAATNSAAALGFGALEFDGPAP